MTSLHSEMITRLSVDNHTVSYINIDWLFCTTKTNIQLYPNKNNHIENFAQFEENWTI